MIDIRRQRSRPSIALSFGFTVSLGFGLGACFDGLDAEGLPCETDAQCGPLLTCEDKYCGGVFACADGTLIELPSICDGTPDCVDGSDEEPSFCGVASEPTPNQCEAEPDQPLSYIEGPRDAGVADPIKVVAENFVDTPQDDVLVAGVGGTFVKIVSFGMGPDSQTQYFLNGDPPSFGTRTIADFEVADLEGDGDLDIVVVTDGDGVGVHVFNNDGVNVPAAYGPAAELPLDLTIRGMELGRFDDDNWIDLVAVVDGPLNKGQVYTAVGDPLAVSNSSNYFFPEFSAVQLDYQTFFDSDAADVDGDGRDDLIVTGDTESGPSMWTIRRNSDGGVGAWEVPKFETTPGPVLEFAVGFLGGPGDQGVDFVAVIDGTRLLPFLNNDKGSFIPIPQPIEGFGAGLSGVTIADVNCDDFADILVNVGDSTELRIWLGDGQGGVFSDIDITIPSVGVPRGGLAVSQFDQDQTWDVIQAVDAGGQLADPEVRVWFTSDPLAGTAP